MSGASAYYHADGNGNITYLMNNDQSLGANYKYDPYGTTLSSSGALATANVYRFSSKEWIGNWGLAYYGYRFYSPSLQRWLNRDPIGESGGINLYGNVKNNPIIRVDPDGHFAIAVPIGIGIRACLVNAACRAAIIQAGIAIGSLVGVTRCKPPPPFETGNCVSPSGANPSYLVVAGAPCRAIENVVYDWQSAPDGTPVYAPVGTETCPCAK